MFFDAISRHTLAQLLQYEYSWTKSSSVLQFNYVCFSLTKYFLCVCNSLEFIFWLRKIKLSIPGVPHSDFIIRIVSPRMRYHFDAADRNNLAVKYRRIRQRYTSNSMKMPLSSCMLLELGEKGKKHPSINRAESQTMYFIVKHFHLRES